MRTTVKSEVQGKRDGVSNNELCASIDEQSVTSVGLSTRYGDDADSGTRRRTGRRAARGDGEWSARDGDDHARSRRAERLLSGEGGELDVDETTQALVDHDE